mmetsp:Transcript_14853/g.16799  ORF Transcript_14853/g.16799 Transcript_14853/m.16799 type:complete len:95 (+) Transcript_14853:104-388(+)
MGFLSLWKYKRKGKGEEAHLESEDYVERMSTHMDIRTDSAWVETIPKNQAVELGTINYLNLPPPGRHGDFDLALKESANAPGKPIFANFVEWSG